MDNELMTVSHALVPANHDSILAIISEAARDERVDADKLERLLAMKERVDAKDAEKAYNSSFAAMSKVLPRVKKNGSIDLGRGKPIPFAKWEDADRVLRPILSEYGFSLSFRTRMEGDKTVMACILSHIAGHSEQSEAHVSADKGPGRNDMQAMGSGRAYMKRYLAFDLLNLISEGADDDGQASGFITTEQANVIHDMLAALELTPAQKQEFWKFARVDAVETLQHWDYERVLNGLRAKLKAKQGSGK